MFSFFYNLALFIIGCIALPNLLWHWFRHGKYRSSLGMRLGFKLPQISHQKGKGAPVIWIHTVSVGETRAVSSLYKRMRESLPNTVIVISTTTETGQAEAKHCLNGADGYFFLPLDFSFIIKKIIRHICPNVLILVESDFWYHLLHEAKQSGAAVLLVNGKVSERSAKRFTFVKSFAKRIFASFDLICLQSERYLERFLKMGVSPAVLTPTGNLKLDVSSKKLTSAEIKFWKEDLGIAENDRVLCIGSTHDPEEEKLLSALDPIWKVLPQLKVILVPRHPERFATVSSQIQEKGYSQISYSERARKKGNERVILIDVMGQLSTCYQLAEIALVGGSFIDGVGGHNIFEPVEIGIPVLFGPYMSGQLDFVDLIVNGHAGRQLSLDQVTSTLLELLQDGSKYAAMKKSVIQLNQETKDSTERTWLAIHPYLKESLNSNKD